ncbi:hypothetical protein CCMA1212_010366 [Trichoderma ghanense]|uniref:Uncharacterized protein n=1 Tax=Trichoderma ghanense TaxID=65468 RepID=A0ABY2GQD4_9HYPO
MISSRQSLPNTKNCPSLKQLCPLCASRPQRIRHLSPLIRLSTGIKGRCDGAISAFNEHRPLGRRLCMAAAESRGLVGALMTVATDAGKGVNPSRSGQLLAPTPTERLHDSEATAEKAPPTGARLACTCSSAPEYGFSSAMMRQLDDVVSTNQIRQSTQHSVMPTGSDNLHQAKQRVLLCLGRRRFRIPADDELFDYVQAQVRACAAAVEIPCGSCPPLVCTYQSNAAPGGSRAPRAANAMPALSSLIRASSSPNRIFATPHWSLAVGLSPQWGNLSITQSPSPAANSAHGTPSRSHRQIFPRFWLFWEVGGQHFALDKGMDSPRRDILPLRAVSILLRSLSSLPSRFAI